MVYEICELVLKGRSVNGQDWYFGAGEKFLVTADTVSEAGHLAMEMLLGGPRPFPGVPAREFYAADAKQIALITQEEQRVGYGLYVWH